MKKENFLELKLSNEITNFKTVVVVSDFYFIKWIIFPQVGGFLRLLRIYNLHRNVVIFIPGKHDFCQITVVQEQFVV